MAERKTLSKKIRFEVFKRDHFTCQYCGRMAPDVILEVDHIQPVAEGGDDDILNLITSCRDCNRGKGKTLLSQNDTLKKSQQQLIDLAEKKEQEEMMIDWKKELLDIRQKAIDAINELILSISGYGLNERGRRDISNCLSQFSFVEVWDATEIAFEKYFDDSGSEWKTTRSFSEALRKIGGICYNRRKAGEDNGSV